MRTKSINKFFCRAVFYALILSTVSTKAADMTITNLFPATGDVEVCADTKLWITSSTEPNIAVSGYLQICKVSDDSNVYKLNLQTLPKDVYGYKGPVWPYKINLNGNNDVNYVPFNISGKTLEIHPSTRFDYNTAYYVKMTAGFCNDSNGNTSPEINDNTTWRFTTKVNPPPADNDYIVALDGSGDFVTVQGAVDAVTNNDANRTLIRLKKGSYREIVNIPSGKINMTWLGEDKDTTIIAGYNREVFNGGTSKRVMVKNSGNGFRMYNMTFWNTAPDNSGQAETIRIDALQCLSQNCKYKSYQDTLLINSGQAYFNNCYIEGDTDYIWGAGTAYFDKCEMRSLSTSSYITQPRAAASPVNGLFLVDCNLTSPPGLMGCYLGRTTNNSYPYCQSVFINCIMPKTLFFPEGWKLAAGTDSGNLRFWEYKSVEQNGNPINVLYRLDPGSRQLTDEEAIYWRDVNNVFAQYPWNPKTLPDLPTASWQPQPIDEANDVNVEDATLTWSAGAGATSQMIYFGTANPPDFAVEQNGTSFATGALTPGTTYYWQVDEKNSAGITTCALWSFTTSPVCTGPIISDLNGDCQVDLYDYARLADAWMGNPPAVDLNNDTILDFFDLDKFADEWLSCNWEPQSQCWQ